MDQRELGSEVSIAFSAVIDSAGVKYKMWYFVRIVL